MARRHHHGGGFFGKLRGLAKNKFVRKIVGKVAPHLIGLVPGGTIALKARDAFVKYRGRGRKILGAVHAVRAATQLHTTHKTVAHKMRAMRIVHPRFIQSQQQRATSFMSPNAYMSGRFHLTHVKNILMARRVQLRSMGHGTRLRRHRALYNLGRHAVRRVG